MTRTISLLDCTLRDGGYVNDWHFGSGTMTCIFDRLNESGVEIIEIGFLDERQPFSKDRTIQPDARSMSEVFSKTLDKKAKTVAMIDYGTCGIENVQPRTETGIDGIRVIFKKENMHKAIAFGKEVMDKGYELFLQMVSITSYEEGDVLEFCEAVNKIRPSAISLVDTYGLMHKEQMFHYFELLDRYLDPSVSIGYHSHNNFQLAYANTIEMLKLNTERNLVVDGTLYGMGKSAGNAPVELLAMHLNENYGKNYNISQMLEAIDVDILPIYRDHYWGYGFLFYISAKNDCHPTYVEYLMNKKTLSIKAVNEILGGIPSELKLKFSKQHIEELYMEYLLDNADDSVHLESLSKELQGKELLLIGPGASVIKEQGMIRRHLEEKRPTVIAVNFMPDGIAADYFFISNRLRYSRMVPHMDRAAKVIATSNIVPVSKKFDYTVDYGKLISEKDEIWDNALVILLNLLNKVGVRSVSLAGFDGFTEKAEQNYVDKSFDLSKNFSYLSAVNSLLGKKLKEYQRDLSIIFLTRSVYEDRSCDTKQ
ncbi:MAG: aldolase catalytic domain-containing protein [Methanomassiliicoccaceae archaeon]|jgi:4-hydroxy 2-oxovalerate aldolase|nr:aldolase catalytic domain-containing protein [Methanomassiliicoccaceae archaeon]